MNMHTDITNVSGRYLSVGEIEAWAERPDVRVTWSVEEGWYMSHTAAIVESHWTAGPDDSDDLATGEESGPA